MALARISLEQIVELNFAISNARLRKNGHTILLQMLRNSQLITDTKRLAAFLAAYIVDSQPFTDGNKRTAAAVLFETLCFNNLTVASPASNDKFLTRTLQVYGIFKKNMPHGCERAANEIYRWIELHAESIQQNPYEAFDKFLDYLRHFDDNANRIKEEQRGYRKYSKLLPSLDDFG